MVFFAGFGLKGIVSQDGVLATPRQRPSTPAASRQRTRELATSARSRRTYESQLEATILADARLMVRVHYFRGPILGVACTPAEAAGRPIIDSVIHLNCLAIKRRVGRTLEGARYLASINLLTGDHTYRGD
jgi:hypothetical protein